MVKGSSISSDVSNFNQRVETGRTTLFLANDVTVGEFEPGRNKYLIYAHKKAEQCCITMHKYTHRDTQV